MVFVDLKKASNHTPTEVIWWALRRKGVVEREIKAIKEMYMNTVYGVCGFEKGF